MATTTMDTTAATATTSIATAAAVVVIAANSSTTGGHCFTLRVGVLVVSHCVPFLPGLFLSKSRQPENEYRTGTPVEQ